MKHDYHTVTIVDSVTQQYHYGIETIAVTHQHANEQEWLRMFFDYVKRVTTSNTTPFN